MASVTTTRGTEVAKPVKLPAMERWPWGVRALLGCVTSAVAVGLTYSIKPLTAFPLMLAFPTGGAHLLVSRDVGRRVLRD